MAVLALLLACAARGPNLDVASPEPPAWDARLTGFPYPYEVSLFPVEAQRQSLELAYMDVRPAEPNGEAVLLLHGKNFSGAYWAATIEALAAEGYRVVVPDQIGFGMSSKPERFQYTFQALATTTAALLDHLDLARVHVVGHSMGGMLGTRFALQFPDRVASLALLNPIGLEDWKRVVPYQTVDEVYAQELRATPESVRAYMADAYFGGEWAPAYEPLITLQVGWLRGPDRELVAWTSALTYDMIFTQPVLYELDQLRVPTLLVIGARDRTALGKAAVPEEVRRTLGDYPSLARAAAERIPDARLELLEGVGHVPQFEDPERTHALLLGFLAERRGAPRSETGVLRSSP